MPDDSQMTRQQYRRLRSLRSRGRPSAANSLREFKSRRLAHHLNRMIIILVILIIVVYLVLVLVNF